MVFVFIGILFKILLFKGGVLIYAEHCKWQSGCPSQKVVGKGSMNPGKLYFFVNQSNNFVKSFVDSVWFIQTVH